MARKSGLFAENKSRLLEDSSSDSTKFAPLSPETKSRWRALMGSMVYPVSATSSYLVPNLVLFFFRILLLIWISSTIAIVLMDEYKSSKNQNPSQVNNEINGNFSALASLGKKKFSAFFFRIHVYSAWIAISHLLLTILISIHGHFSKRRTWSFIANFHASWYAALISLPPTAAGLYFLLDWHTSEDVINSPKTTVDWYNVTRIHFAPAVITSIEFLFGTITPTLYSVIVVLWTTSAYFILSLLSKHILGDWAFEYMDLKSPNSGKFYGAGVIMSLGFFFCAYLLHIIRDVVFLPLRRRMLKSMDPVGSSGMLVEKNDSILRSKK